MSDYFKRKKTLDQKLWEQRKLKIAGIKTDKIEIKTEKSHINLDMKDEYKNNKIESCFEKIFDFTNTMYLIGIRRGIFFEKHGDDRIEFDIKKNYNSGSTQKSTTNAYKNLPVYSHKLQFLDFFADNNVSLVTGETGCGKSTLVPKFIFDKYKCRMCITQPRRVSVKSLYARMKLFYDREIGYVIKDEHCVSSTTKIKFVTEGILLKELSVDPSLSQYDVVICDEVHERSVALDIILGFLKIITQKRKNFKIILMSATLMISDFQKFFDAKVFNFTGNAFNVDIRYIKVNVDDYIEWIYKKIVTVHNTLDKGDILVFLTGKGDIHQIYSILKLTKFTYKLDVIPFYAEIMDDVYSLVFKYESPNRRCILATNIAETSVTISNIKYVIDSGLHKISYYDYNLGERLIKYPISKENAAQRAGRAGRTMPGICYRMYTKETFLHDMSDSSIPEIKRSNISFTILLFLSTNYRNFDSFPFITRPDTNTLTLGFETLFNAGCIDWDRNILSDGFEILKIGEDITIGKLILEGIKHNCLYDASLLASILSFDSYSLMDYFAKCKDNNEFSRYYNKHNDFISLVAFFKFEFKNKKLMTGIVSKVKHKHEKLIDRLKHIGYRITNSGKLQNVILKTFYYNICRKADINYVKLSNNLIYKRHDLYEECEYVLFYKSYKNKKNDLIMQITCTVNPEAVLECLGDFFVDKNSISSLPVPYISSLTNNLYERFETESDDEI